jgi:hypothetical protein
MGCRPGPCDPDPEFWSGALDPKAGRGGGPLPGRGRGHDHGRPTSTPSKDEVLPAGVHLQFDAERRVLRREFRQPRGRRALIEP